MVIETPARASGKPSKTLVPGRLSMLSWCLITGANMARDILVLGAGMVGVSCALSLQKRG